MMTRNKFFAVATATVLLSVSAFAKAPGTIVEVAVKAGKFKTLASLLTKAGLVDTLNGSGPFTVFAPTDAAFAKVPKAILTQIGNDPELLKAVLTYHVVSGNVMAKQVVGLKKATTVEGEDIHIKVVGGKVILNGKVTVTKTDIEASNGVIHIVDSVLVPKSVMNKLMAAKPMKKHH